MHFCRITGAKYSTCHKEVTEVWELSQWLVKTFVEWNVHNTFVHHLKFDEILQ